MPPMLQQAPKNVYSFGSLRFTGRTGLPIATGVIEGACRHLVKDRMDITGARWGLDQAEAILKLRSQKVSDGLSAYWTFHFRREHERNYPTAPIPELLKKLHDVQQQKS